MVVGTRILTADGYLLRPEAPGEQLIDGMVVDMNEPRALHQRVLGRLYVALGAWVAAGADRGEVSLARDVRLATDQVYGPDLLWVADAAALDPDWLDGPPDLVAEILSPRTRHLDLGPKRAAYQAAGLRELWLIDPEAEVVDVLARSTPGAPQFDVVTRLDHGDILTSPLLGSFTLPIASLLQQ